MGRFPFGGPAHKGRAVGCARATPRFPGGSRSSARAAAGINLVNIFPSVHTPDAAKQRAFREMGQSVKPLDPWPLASIELEGKAKERRSSDGQ